MNKEEKNKKSEYVVFKNSILGISVTSMSRFFLVVREVRQTGLWGATACAAIAHSINLEKSLGFAAYKIAIVRQT